ncbi:MAG: hypothetical protein II547_07615, partial [Treponema sp.]|nr:hypothetical protein [Treponema sp.]
FYQSLIDADSLLKGADYEDLPRTIIIFICTTDPFNLGLPKYTFRTTCKEADRLNPDDNAEKIIYNASAYADVNDRELGAFLRFVSEDKSSDSFTEKLKERVYGIKADEIFRKEYMSMGIWESDIRKEATKEGIEQGSRIKSVEAALVLIRNYNVPAETAAQQMGAPLNMVLTELEGTDVN